jgi:cytoskeletal protein CcmA (bactofilin family)
MKQQQVGTIVGSSVHLTGAIKDSSDITIFGSVEGEVHSEQKVIVEESAYVKGPINAQEVIVSGVIVGTVNAKDRFELNPSGSIKGNIDTKSLLIHAGATFIGKCNMPEKKGSETAVEAKDFDFEAEKEEASSEEKPEEKTDEKE